MVLKYRASAKEAISSEENPIVDLNQSKGNITEEQNRNRKRKISSYFYQVNDHPNLTKVGESYYKDLTRGLKSFAISSTGYIDSQQKTILALASFFDHKERFKILIVSNNLEHGLYKEFIQDSSNLKLREDNDTGPAINFHRFHDHFDFISFYSIFLFSHGDGPDSSFENGVNDVLKNYDVILWDIPSLGEVQSKSKFFFPLMAKFDSLTIIVAQNISQYSELEEVKNFFNSYGVNLKGLLIDTSHMSTSARQEESKK